MVDPDNRRQVDFEHRIKMYVLMAALRFRRDQYPGRIPKTNRQSSFGRSRARTAASSRIK